MAAILRPNIDTLTDTNEQALLESLSTEFIRLHSFVVTYLPKTLQREDTLYNEDVLRKIQNAISVPVYIKDVNGWGGTGDFMSKFSIRIQDTVSIVVSRSRFTSRLADVGVTRPTEGDLVYFPAPFDALFEIKWVEHERSEGQFYPLNSLYFYELHLELHVYNQESFATGNSSLDIFESNRAYAQTLTLDTGSGSYTVGETVYQGPSVANSTASGVVGSWDSGSKTLRLTFLSGTFANGVSVRGATSNSVYVLSSPVDALELPNSSTADNHYLDSELDSVVDSRESNPLGR